MQVIWPLSQNRRSLAESYFAREPSQSRVCQSPDQSDSTLPLTVSPVILPLYLAVTFRPSRSRTILKLTSSPTIFPSWICVSLSLRTATPVNLSPSCLSLSAPSMRLPSPRISAVSQLPAAATLLL